MKIFLLFISALIAYTHAGSDPETEVAEYIKTISLELQRLDNKLEEAQWAYQTNLTEENEQRYNELSTEQARFIQDIPKEISKYDWHSFKSDDLRRQCKFMTFLGLAILPEADYSAYQDAVSAMTKNFATIKVCDFKNPHKCDLTLDPEIEEILAKSRDPEELAYYWREFYDKAGTPQVRGNYEALVKFMNKAANLNNFTSGAELWLDDYEDDTFEQEVERIFDELRPLYLQLHGYVRYRLRQHYGDEVVSAEGPIPMHLLGNMWGQEWENIADIVSPYTNKVDVSDEMVKQGYTPRRMVELADDFYTSLNLTKLPPIFWEKSIFEKPKDGRELVCHASAWDFKLIDDVRIKMCTRVTQDQLVVVHHELGHLQYYLQYQHLPYVYREGTNPGFHEAIGDTIALSMSTPKHLQRIGLLKNDKNDHETRINSLFFSALNKVTFLPFAYTMDKYRWALFRGQIPKENWNCGFWKLRDDHGGIEPPVVRSEEHFDPPAKYHISQNIEYLRYFVARILQYQFHQTLCMKAGQYEPNNPELPLDNFDIYGSAEAGNAFSKLLSVGQSKHWRDVLEAFNGERRMSGKPMAEYFEPLRVWLEEENRKHNVPIGWTKSNKCV